jgi:hypothetical protein
MQSWVYDLMIFRFGANGLWSLLPSANVPLHNHAMYKATTELRAVKQERDNSLPLLKNARKGVTKWLKQRLTLPQLEENPSNSPEPSSCGPSQISREVLQQDNGLSSCKLMADLLHFPVSFTMADAVEARTGTNNNILYPIYTLLGLRLPIKSSQMRHRCCPGAGSSC